MVNLVQALVKKTEAAGEHLAADVRAILIKAHEELDALFEHDKAVVEKVEAKVETDITLKPATEPVLVIPPAGVPETGNAAPAAPTTVAAETATTPVTDAGTVVSVPEMGNGVTTASQVAAIGVTSSGSDLGNGSAAAPVDVAAASGTATDAPAAPTETAAETK